MTALAILKRKVAELAPPERARMLAHLIAASRLADKNGELPQRANDDPGRFFTLGETDTLLAHLDQPDDE